MPVEARDVGIFIGFLFMFVFIFAARIRLSPGKDSIYPIVISLVLLVPLMIDAGSSYTGLRETTNGIRLLTGLLFGVGAGIVISGLERSISAPSNKQITMKHMLSALIVVPLYFLIEWSCTSTLAGFIAFSLLSVVGYILIFFIGIRILIIESDIRWLNKWKTPPRVFILTVMFESVLFTLLGVAHYFGMLIS